MDEDDLQSYLYFGAVYGDLRTEGLPLLADAPSDRDREWAASASEDQLVREGVRCLREATQEALAQTSESRHAVFLSAGFDSRALLGSLLEHLSADELVTLTFGTPGALDYEIPARVSKDVGVRHERLDATSVSWDVASVTAFARSELSLPAPEIDGEFISYNLWNRLDAGMAYWTGFLGGHLAGSRLPDPPSSDWEEAVSVFLRRNRQAKSAQLAAPDWNVRALLPDGPIVDEARIAPDDQLEMAGRQTFRIGSVRRTRRPVQPFTQPVWKRFMLSLPLEQRLGGAPLYHRILREAFPDLFHLPVQGGSRPARHAPPHRDLVTKALRRGRRVVRRISPRLARRHRLRNVQKLDYERLLRTESAYADYVRTGLDGIAARCIVDHLDIEQLWHEHRAGAANHTESLRILSSLEMNLRALAPEQR